MVLTWGRLAGAAVFANKMLHQEGGCRSQWPRGLRRGSAAARLLGLRVRIPPGAWMCVCFECCVLSGRGLCYGCLSVVSVVR